ncbi:MAG: hypothetical protein DRH08_00390 [Deltaproteobacteria bacterium]|nr:MAG: hypothetical protein DRH08_00390 [Deltaproteobacteria bacterium]
MRRKLTDTKKFTGNDDLYPTEVKFVNGLNVCIACSEDGQMYLRVEDSLNKFTGELSSSAMRNQCVALAQ